MQQFLRYNINVIKEDNDKNYGKYIIKPLERGFGVTIGNALRRVMLSHLPGSSVFALKIEGASHEFGFIPGVKEDVTEIVLNVKNLVVWINDNVISDQDLIDTPIEKWPVMTIRAKKAGIIKAGDIECPPGFEIINKELEICTLSEDAELNIDIYATRGRGFKPAADNRAEIGSLSIIPVDSNFSPIIKVGYQVEEKTSDVLTDELIIEVATNGLIKSGDAIGMASKILSDHLKPLIDINKSLHDIQVLNEKNVEEKNKKLSIPIEQLDLTVRSYNCLKRHGIQTVEELVTRSKSEIENIRNLGKKSVREINKKLSELYDLKLKNN
ncbi:DNA-directed RNA polymerase subunit alpha [Mycoplasma sp. E35C]|uniref:DNA-directed RNA polymerase subunit alpha n=1 Tax=Mycoplasma sp. E35C TaxID=2801918 RepID=UPI001CA43754|nr:DNA-directed RNA polymerase subunit alpha [Mycoplasma sp. E35C]QZX49063.1 DNA-directed RNA polymerase subunit alpha [Mycoplasma sp. E35C]